MTRTFRDEKGTSYEMVRYSSYSSDDLVIRKIEPPKPVEKTDVEWENVIAHEFANKRLYNATDFIVKMVNAKLKALEAKLEGK